MGESNRLNSAAVPEKKPNCSFFVVFFLAVFSAVRQTCLAALDVVHAASLNIGALQELGTDVVSPAFLGESNRLNSAVVPGKKKLYFFFGFYFEPFFQPDGRPV